MGELPDWFPVLKAAKYLGVAPWDLIKQPVVWMTWAMELHQAEREAAQNKQESAARALA